MPLHFLLILLLGCSSVGKKFQLHQSSDQRQSVIYIYRPTAPVGSLWQHELFVDGEPVGNLSEGSYKSFETTPGQHILNLVIRGTKASIDLKVRSGESYFLKTTPAPGFNLMSRERGLAEIQGTKLSLE